MIRLALGTVCMVAAAVVGAEVVAILYIQRELGV